MTYKDIVAGVSAFIALISAKSQVFAGIMAIYHNPVWCLVVALAVTVWWLWRTRRLAWSDVDHYYTRAEDWRKKYERECKIYDQLIADLSGESMRDTLNAVWAYHAKQHKQRKTYNNPRRENRQ